MTKNFLPDNYEQPVLNSGGYMKLKEGANKFRVLSSAIVGYEYWTVQNKPVRSKTPFKGTPEDARLTDDGRFKQKHFWAFVVWNYAEEAVQILEITQATIQDAINAIVKNEEWGDPHGYDLTIRREGEGLDTGYTVHPSPHKNAPKEALEAFKAKSIKLDALYVGANPFETADPFGLDEAKANVPFD